jgi:APA family basic amino acid/polyamine antiporter
VNVTVIVLRYREPETPRPFRTPLSIGRMPVLPVLGLISVGVMFSGVDAKPLAAGAVLSVAGLAAGLFLDARSPLRRGSEGAGG